MWIIFSVTEGKKRFLGIYTVTIFIKVRKYHFTEFRLDPNTLKKQLKL